MTKRSVEFDLILRISILFILVILAVSSVTIMYMSNQYNSNILQNMNQNIENTVKTVDYYFEDVKTPMVMLSRNDNVVKAVKDYQNMTNKEKLENTKDLSSFVQNIVTFKSFINDMIIIGNNGYLYNIYNENSDKYLNNFDFLNSEYLSEASEGPIRLYYKGAHFTEYYIHSQMDSMVYSVILPISQGKIKRGYIICDLKADTIEGAFDGYLENNKSKIIIQDETGNIVFEGGSPELSAEEIIKNENVVESVTSQKNIFEILFFKGNYVTTVKSEVTGWSFTYAEAYENFNGLIKRIFYFNLITICLGVMIIIFFSIQLSRRILRPLKNIAFSIQEMKINHRPDQKVMELMKRQNVNELSLEIEYMIQRMDKLINDNYIYELKSKEAQIQLLLNQLSPHYLYNTLQLIEYQAYYGTKENISQIIDALSNILRYSINGEKEIALREEIKYIRSYLNIYCLRYYNKLSYCIEGDKKFENIQIPKMILEPVVNNCIKHGFAGELENAEINIVIYKESENLIISVKDNGKGIPEDKLNEIRNNLKRAEILKEHIGLNNVHSVLHLWYGEEYGVKIESQLGQYTEVILTIPIVYMDRGNTIEKSSVG